MNIVTETLNRCYLSESISTMSPKKIEKQIMELLDEQLGIPAREIKRKKYLSELGMDSLDFVEVVMAIEEDFAVVIPDETFDGFNINDMGKTTIKQFIDVCVEFIQQYHKRKPDATKVKKVIKNVITKLGK